MTTQDRAQPQAAKANVLLLSIQKQHADRIFGGDKRFELRKQLPHEPFERVFLYETGGTGVIGYFDVAKVVRLPVESLWDLVGERGTTRERFEAYFSGRKQGCAIEVGQYRRFERPMPSSELKQADSSFIAPRSYMVIRPADPLFAALARTADRSEPRATDQEILLRGIQHHEHDLYAVYVQKEISRNYDDIDDSFARANLATAELGEDPFALLTVRKDVLAIKRIDGAVLGFTTLTYKHGGSVKSGPTILLPEHRGHGYGTRVRRMLEEVARAGGARKIYATAPDVSDAVLGYLLKAGMVVEAHLQAQYSKTHGEIVLGKILADEATGIASKSTYDARAGQVLRAAELTMNQAAQAVSLGLSSYGVRVRREHARALVRNMGLDAAYDRKPRDLVALRSGDAIVAGVILSAKRGGAMRGVLGTSTSHRPSLVRLLTAAEETARSAKRRKLYFLHPQDSPLDLDTLRDHGYVTEGLLREPYMRSQNLVVMSKFL